MKSVKNTVLHLHFKTPRKVVRGAVYSLIKAGFSDQKTIGDQANQKEFPHYGTLIEQLSSQPEDRPVYLAGTGYRDDSTYCRGSPKHRLTHRVKDISADLFGGKQVVDFVSDDGADFFTISTKSATSLRQSGLTGYELLPISLNLSSYRFSLPCPLMALRFDGRPCGRIATLVNENRCAVCGQNDIFCSLCGFWFIRCPRCKSSIDSIIHDDLFTDHKTESIFDQSSVDSHFILDGDRYDGTDFISGEFVSASAIDWFRENGVRGFISRQCLLVYQ